MTPSPRRARPVAGRRVAKRGRRLVAPLAAALAIGCGEEEEAREGGSTGGDTRVESVAEGLEGALGDRLPP